MSAWKSKERSVDRQVHLTPQPIIKNMLKPRFVSTLGRMVYPTISAVLIAGRVGAAPYASHVTNNAGTIQFILNENSDNAYVLFDSGSVSNNLGALTRGPQSFALGAHTNYAIGIFK